MFAMMTVRTVSGWEEGQLACRLSDLSHVSTLRVRTPSAHQIQSEYIWGVLDAHSSWLGQARAACEGGGHSAPGYCIPVKAAT